MLLFRGIADNGWPCVRFAHRGKNSAYPLHIDLISVPAKIYFLSCRNAIFNVSFSTLEALNLPLHEHSRCLYWRDTTPENFQSCRFSKKGLMKNYDDLTIGMQAILMHFSRGYGLTTVEPIIVSLEKINSISEKFIDSYGTNLPAWKRLQRKEKGLPNCVGVVIPVVGNPYKKQIVLLCTEHKPAELNENNPFLNEKWQSKIQLGDFEIAKDQRDRGDSAFSWKLKKSTLLGFEAHLKNLLSKGQWHQIIEELSKAVKFYPAFGGIRRQLRRLIGGYKKLYEKKHSTEWAGPDPENLPKMVGFRKYAGTTRETKNANT